MLVKKLDVSTLEKNTILIATRYHKTSLASFNRWNEEAGFIVNLQIHCDLAGGIFNGLRMLVRN